MWKDREIKFEQGTEEWLESRLAKLTGSIYGQIMPGKTGKVPDWSKLKYTKAVQLMAGVDESKPINQFNADWGHEWEPFACEAYTKKTGTELIETGLITSDFNEYIATSPDRVAKDNSVVLEVKCPTTMEKHLQYIDCSPVLKLSSIAIEKNYYWQIRHHMLCTGIKVGDWASFHHAFKPMPISINRVEWDQKEMDTMMELGDKFIKEMKVFAKEILIKGEK
jgi:hypothetical protein